MDRDRASSPRSCSTPCVVFNRLVRGRNLVREGFSGIDVQLKRRTDLVPNLVETVKPTPPTSAALFDEIAAKRARA